MGDRQHAEARLRRWPPRCAEPRPAGRRCRDPSRPRPARRTWVPARPAALSRCASSRRPTSRRSSGRTRNLGSNPMRLASAATSSGTSARSRPAAVSASPRASSRLTPGTSVGYCGTMNSPAWARFHVGRARRSMPSRLTPPAVTWMPGRPIRTWASVLLPEPLGPITAWTSPLRSSRSIPSRISRSGTPARSPATERTLLAGAGLPGRRSTPAASVRPPGPASRAGVTHHHVVALDLDLVHRHRLCGGQAEWFARLE